MDESVEEVQGSQAHAAGIEGSQTQTGGDNDLPPLPPLKKRKPTRKPSEVWNHFEKFETGNPSEPIRVRCKYCKTADHKYDPANCGTSRPFWRLYYYLGQ
ncbi:hypothetical protein Pyn_38711 [Prunus yedoensis var. nudiflora]|uniref:BED-type domain-containing protein n=1 Tax=Prunus yedoensis var. nudiflora TaxID=2094558 RepID=A0A314Z1F0_PRUYE|nr:hypothetical protein Pyn_38711 [Prunus yedoensis var. nudiflora]